MTHRLLRRSVASALVYSLCCGAAFGQAQPTMPASPGCNSSVQSALVQSAQQGATSSIGRIRNSFTAPQSLTGLSCLNNILAMGSKFDLAFSMSSLVNGVLQAAQQFACQALTQELQQVTQQFNVSTFFAGIPATAPASTNAAIPPTAITPLPPTTTTPPPTTITPPSTSTPPVALPPTTPAPTTPAPGIHVPPSQQQPAQPGFSGLYR